MSLEELKYFIEQWKENGSRFMIIVCDTYDYEDFPVFCDEEECLQKIKAPGTMQRIMEVYDNQIDLEFQREEDRAYHPPGEAG